MSTGVVAFAVAIEIVVGIAVQIVAFQAIDAGTTFSVGTGATTTTTATTTAAAATAPAFAIGCIVACGILGRCSCICVGATISSGFAHHDIDRMRLRRFIGVGLRIGGCSGVSNGGHHARRGGRCGSGGHGLRRCRTLILACRTRLPLGWRAVLLCRRTWRAWALVLRLGLLLLRLLLL